MTTKKPPGGGSGRPPAPARPTSAAPPNLKRPQLRPIGAAKAPAVRPVVARPSTAPRPPAPSPIPRAIEEDDEDDATKVMDRPGFSAEPPPAATKPGPSPTQPPRPAAGRPPRPSIDVVPKGQHYKGQHYAAEQTAVMTEVPVHPPPRAQSTLARTPSVPPPATAGAPRAQSVPPRAQSVPPRATAGAPRFPSSPPPRFPQSGGSGAFPPPARPSRATLPPPMGPRISVAPPRPSEFPKTSELPAVNRPSIPRPPSYRPPPAETPIFARPSDLPVQSAPVAHEETAATAHEGWMPPAPAAAYGPSAHALRHSTPPPPNVKRGGEPRAPSFADVAATRAQDVGAHPPIRTSLAAPSNTPLQLSIPPMAGVAAAQAPAMLGLVLFAAPLAFATLVVAALALL